MVEPSWAEQVAALSWGGAAALAAAEALGAAGDRRAVAPLIETLERTSDPLLRNAAALALRDLGDPRAVAPLVRAIERPDTAGYRGSLVRALRAFDCGPLFPQVIDWLIAGNFEVGREAFLILEELQSPLALADVERARDQLRRALPAADDDKRRLIEEALQLMSETGPAVG